MGWRPDSRAAKQPTVLALTCLAGSLQGTAWWWPRVAAGGLGLCGPPRSISRGKTQESVRPW